MSVSSRVMAIAVGVVAVAVVAVGAISGDDDGGNSLSPAPSPTAVVAASPAASGMTSPAVASPAVASSDSSSPDPTSPSATSPSATSPAVTSPTLAAETTPLDSAAPTIGTPDPKCAAEGHSALVDRKKQRTYLCTDGMRGEAMVMTSAWSMPDPGTYKIYAKDLKATSNFGGHFSRMTHFVAFSYGKRTGARVAFHSIPKLTNGEFVQPLSSVGDLGRRGESNGCIRVLPDDAVRIWDHLAIGDPVIVLN